MKNSDSRKTLNLLFPQWQGSGASRELFHGARAVERELGHIDFSEVAVSLETENEIEFGIYAFSAVHEQLKRASGLITSADPDKILTIGGDCGVEVGPVSFLNKKYGNDLTVIWFDAHGDLNIPEDSPSGHFHGMPLRTLLGEGNKTLVRACFSHLCAEQVILAGGRDFDTAETVFIEKNKIDCFSVPQLEKMGDDFFESIRGKQAENLYIHIDLDVLDPLEFEYVKCPAKDGVSFETLKQIMFRLNREFNIAGVGIVEYSPRTGSGIDKIEELIEAWG